jgi:GNAT superfamily N-acetyltransferase
VPAIVRLSLPRHRLELDQHFAALTREDLRRRFCHTISLDGVARWLDSHTETGVSSYGIFNSDLDLIAVGQFGAYGGELEVGLSVRSGYRRRGMAAALLFRAASFARVRALTAVMIHCLADNWPMLSLAHRIGMTVQISQGEAAGRLKLRAGTAVDFWNEIAYDELGIVDSMAKSWQEWFRNHHCPAIQEPADE